MKISFIFVLSLGLLSFTSLRADSTATTQPSDLIEQNLKGAQFCSVGFDKGLDADSHPVLRAWFSCDNSVNSWIYSIPGGMNVSYYAIAADVAKQVKAKSDLRLVNCSGGTSKVVLHCFFAAGS